MSHSSDSLDKAWSQVKKDFSFFSSKKTWTAQKKFGVLTIMLMVLGIGVSSALVGSNSEIRQQAQVYANCIFPSTKISGGVEDGGCRCPNSSQVINPGQDPQFHCKTASPTVQILPSVIPSSTKPPSGCINGGSYCSSGVLYTCDPSRDLYVPQPCASNRCSDSTRCSNPEQVNPTPIVNNPTSKPGCIAGDTICKNGTLYTCVNNNGFYTSQRCTSNTCENQFSCKSVASIPTNRLSNLTPTRTINSGTVPIQTVRPTNTISFRPTITSTVERTLSPVPTVTPQLTTQKSWCETFSWMQNYPLLARTWRNSCVQKDEPTGQTCINLPIIGTLGQGNCALPQPDGHTNNELVPLPTFTPLPTTEPTSFPTPTACTMTVNGVSHSVNFRECGCGIPGYEDKKCAGNNQMVSSPGACAEVCNPLPTSAPNQSISCNDSALDFPESFCEGKNVGEACGNVKGQICGIVNTNPPPYCDCILPLN